MSASALRASHHSTECTCRFIRAEIHPPCRPASVACSVATSGTSKCCARAMAACATNQSWACTTCGRQSNASPARTMAWPSASVHAIMSSVNTRCAGSSATAITRTPSTRASLKGCVPASLPVG